MSTSLVDSPSAWCEERAAWDELHATNPGHTPFQRFDWLATWWNHLGNGRLYVVRVEDAGGLIGYAPLYVRGRYFGLPLAHLTFIGDGRADYLDFLVRPGAEPQFFDQLLGFLEHRRGEFGFIDLEGVPDSSTTGMHLARTADAGRWRAYERVSETCVAIALAGNWQDQLGTLGARTRKDVAYDRRYLDRRAHAELLEYRDPAHIECIYSDLVGVYRARWAGESATRYDDPASASFEREMLEAVARSGDLRVWVLCINGDPAAWISGYVQGDRLFADTVVHSPSYRKYSAGNVLLGRVLERCIEEGFTEFDLSRGAEGYKYRWGGVEKRNLHFLLAGSAPRMQTALLPLKAYRVATRLSAVDHVSGVMRRLSGGSR